MRTSITKTIADKLNSLSWNNQSYEFFRVNTFNWDPQETDDLYCYIIPRRYSRVAQDRMSTSRYWHRMPQVSLVFVKMIETSKQDEVDALEDTIENILNTIGQTFFVDTYQSTNPFTYIPVAIEEEDVPEEWMLRHQATQEEQLYSGLWIKLITLGLEEVPGTHNA